MKRLVQQLGVMVVDQQERFAGQEFCELIEYDALPLRWVYRVRLYRGLDDTFCHDEFFYSNKDNTKDLFTIYLKCSTMIFHKQYNLYTLNKR